MHHYDKNSRSWRPGLNTLRGELGAEETDALGPATKVVGVTALLPPPSTPARPSPGKMRPGLQAIASRLKERRGNWEPLVPPVYHTANYRHPSFEDYEANWHDEGYVYQRYSNPTNEHVEVLIAELEGAAGSLLYGSGLDAVTSVLLTFLKAGDHLVCQRPCYPGTASFVSRVLGKFGVEASWVEAGAAKEEWEAALRPNTRLLYGETPTNPTTALLDVEMFGGLGDGSGRLTVVDATFASPHLVQPLKAGVDVVLHSCSKYMGGHSDLIAGCASVRQLHHWQELKGSLDTLGGQLAPQPASLLHRGLRTLALRVERQSRSALELARFLEAQPQVQAVLYPGLESHPQHGLGQRQLKDGLCGGMLAFRLESEVAARTLLKSLRIVSCAVSLGGVESNASLASAPEGMTKEEVAKAGLGPGSLRLSVGVEDVQDLVQDFAQALDHVGVAAKTGSADIPAKVTP